MAAVRGPAVNTGRAARTARSRCALRTVFQHHQARRDAAFVSECDGVFSQAPQPRLEGVQINPRWPGDGMLRMAWWGSSRSAPDVTRIQWRGQSGMLWCALPSPDGHSRRLPVIGIKSLRAGSLREDSPSSGWRAVALAISASLPWAVGLCRRDATNMFRLPRVLPQVVALVVVKACSALDPALGATRRPSVGRAAVHHPSILEFVDCQSIVTLNVADRWRGAPADQALLMVMMGPVARSQPRRRRKWILADWDAAVAVMRARGAGFGQRRPEPPVR